MASNSPIFRLVTFESEEITVFQPDVILKGAAKANLEGISPSPVKVFALKTAYIIRVQLPTRPGHEDLGYYKCNLAADGRVVVKGILAGGEAAEASISTPIVISRRVRQILPPGPFSIGFKLPTPIESTSGAQSLLNHGVLQLTVLKAESQRSDSSG